MSKERIVAIGLLTRRDLDLLGPTFEHVWPIEEAPCFNGLLQAIDEAEGDVWRERDRAASKASAEDQGSQAPGALPRPVIP